MGAIDHTHPLSPSLAVISKWAMLLPTMAAVQSAEFRAMLSGPFVSIL